MMEVEGAPRDDGRQDNQIRALACERGLLNRADGSVRWTQDTSVVLAAVYGPRTVPGYKEEAEKCSVEVIIKPALDIPSTPERELEHVLKKTLESVIVTSLHPRCGLTVVLQVVNADGSLLACLINAACAALVDAGVAMTGMLAAVSMVRLRDGRLLLDPTLVEEQEAEATITFAFGNVKQLPDRDPPTEPTPVVTSVTTGSLPVDEYFQCVDLGRTACERVSAFFQLSLERYQLHNLKLLGSSLAKAPEQQFQLRCIGTASASIAGSLA